MTDVHYLLLSTGLTWLMIMTAAELRTPTWTRAGARLAFGNRGALPEASALAARADRAAKNMLENMVLLVAVLVAARAVAADATTGAAIFFFARAAYFVVYLAGIPILRSVIWGVSLIGLGWIALAALGVVG
jgi:uncharacterized MAPEG superfamily protein